MCLAQFSYTGMIKKIDVQQERDIQHLLSSMVKEFDDCLPSREDVLSGLLKVFLIHLRRLPDSVGPLEEDDEHVELVNVFCSRLEQHFLTKRTVSEYAADLLVSAQHLDLTVRRITGFPADYHIRRRLILEAKRFAIFSRETMRDIASRLGFQDLSYFQSFLQARRRGSIFFRVPAQVSGLGRAAAAMGAGRWGRWPGCVGGQALFGEHGLWQHDVDADIAVDELRDVDIRGYAAEHIGIGLCHLFFFHQPGKIIIPRTAICAAALRSRSVPMEMIMRGVSALGQCWVLPLCTTS